LSSLKLSPHDIATVPPVKLDLVHFRPVRLAYQPPASSTFLSQETSHQQPAATSQQYSSLRTNQHQPSATSQPNTPSWLLTAKDLYTNFICSAEIITRVDHKHTEIQ
jgi:hypothetical protein